MGNFSMLPTDVMLEILSRVPTDSALECKLVSRPWRNVIQNPSFPHMHLNHLMNDSDSGNLSSFIFWNHEPYSYTEYDESLNCFSRPKKIKLNHPFEKICFILGSCNGLLCFISWFKDHYSPAYICNPVTREFIVLPQVEVKDMCTGFGYIPSTNEYYKVVSICNRKGEERHLGFIQVYTLGSGVGWRNVGKVEIEHFVGQPGKFANGAIYWVDRKNGTVIAFDLAAEEVHFIPSPPCSPRRNGKFYLQPLGDLLCVNYEYAGCYDIWVYRKDKHKQDMIWGKKFRQIDVEPITLTKSGGLLCYDHQDNIVYCHAPDDSSMRTRVDFGADFIYAEPHRNTLMSLKALGEADAKLMDSGESGRSSRESQRSGH